MADKKNTTEVVVGEQHRVHVDPRYGLRLPDAPALADTGVVTNSQNTIDGGGRLAVAPEDAQALEDAGAARKAG